jgi:magnesium transporter
LVLEIYETGADGVTKKIFTPKPGCWVSIVAPNDGQRAWLKNKSGIVADFVAATLDDEESSHIDFDDDTEQVLVIIDCPAVEDARESEDPSLVQYDTHPLSIIFMPDQDMIVTVSLQENETIKAFTSGKIRGLDTHLRTRFLLQLLLHISHQYQRYLLSIRRQFNRTEKILRKTLRNDELIKMLGLEKSLVYFSTSLKADESTITRINNGRVIKLYEDDRDLLDDVLIETRQAIEMAQIYTNILNGTMDAFGSVINNNLSLVMRTLTIITVVLAVPTIVFSFYGMNVSLPFQDWPWVFPLALAIVLSILVAIIFKQNHMFK